MTSLESGPFADPGFAKFTADVVPAGKNPSQQVASVFWFLVMEHAVDTKDAALAQRAFGEVEQSLGAGNGLVEAVRKQIEQAGLS